MLNALTRVKLPVQFPEVKYCMIPLICYSGKGKKYRNRKQISSWQRLVGEGLTIEDRH